MHACRFTTGDCSCDGIPRHVFRLLARLNRNACHSLRPSFYLLPPTSGYASYLSISPFHSPRNQPNPPSTVNNDPYHACRCMHRSNILIEYHCSCVMSRPEGVTFRLRRRRPHICISALLLLALGPLLEESHMLPNRISHLILSRLLLLICQNSLVYCVLLYFLVHYNIKRVQVLKVHEVQLVFLLGIFITQMQRIGTICRRAALE